MSRTVLNYFVIRSPLVVLRIAAEFAHLSRQTQLTFPDARHSTTLSCSVCATRSTGHIVAIARHVRITDSDQSDPIVRCIFRETASLVDERKRGRVKKDEGWTKTNGKREGWKKARDGRKKPASARKRKLCANVALTSSCVEETASRVVERDTTLMDDAKRDDSVPGR